MSARGRGYACKARQTERLGAGERESHTCMYIYMCVYLG